MSYDEPILEKGEWQCIYCGRFMDDVKAVHRVKDVPWRLHACEICNALIPLSNADTIPGRQAFVRGIVFNNLPPGDNPRAPELRTYVGRRGKIELKTKVANRVD